MKKKATIVDCTALLLVGAGAIALNNRPNQATQSDRKDSGLPTSVANNAGGIVNTGNVAERSGRNRTRNTGKDPELVLKYGESPKGAIVRIKKDPTSLMQVFLASDALARGEIDEEEYKRIQAINRIIVV